MYRGLSQELGFPYEQCGSLVLAFNTKEEAVLESLLQNGLSNGVKDLKILSRKEVLSKEPLLNPDVRGALSCSETGIASPYEAAVALAENAVANGVVLRLNHPVTAMEKEGDRFLVRAGEASFSSTAVINAAGVNSDQTAALLGQDSFKIRPRRGEYLLLKEAPPGGSAPLFFRRPVPWARGYSSARQPGGIC